MQLNLQAVVGVAEAKANKQVALIKFYLDAFDHLWVQAKTAAKNGNKCMEQAVKEILIMRANAKVD